jgi:transcriptional regulator with XRE-family HTH domain
MAGKVAPLPVRRALSGLGEDFATWRRLRGLTIAQVAERADVTRGTVSRLENGAGATLENTLRIARALGILDGLARSADPYATDVGRLRSEEVLPQRVRTKRSAKADTDESTQAATRDDRRTRRSANGATGAR